MSNTVLVTGNTYPVKDAIKALGGRWDAVVKGWRVPAEQAPKAQALVAGAPRQTFRPQGLQASDTWGRGTRYSRPTRNGYGRPCGAPGCTGGRTRCDECSE